MWPWQKKRNGYSLVVLFSDTHPNSKVGLFAPPGLEDEDGVRHLPSEAQLQLWEWWLDFWQWVKGMIKEYDAECYVVLVGDGADDNKHSKYGLVTLNKKLIVQLSVDVHKPAREVADWFFVLRGTPAHVGEYGELEEMVAEKLEAEKSPLGMWSWWWLDLLVADVLINAEHHPQTNSRRPWTHAAQRQGAMVFYDYASTGDRVPDVAVRGHSHGFDDSGIAVKPRTIYLWPWQLTTAFGHRLGLHITPVGGIALLCKDGQYQVFERSYRPERREPWQKG